MQSRRGAPFDLVIAHGLVVTPAGTMTADVGIAGGAIAAIGTAASMPSSGERLDAAGLVVLPGLIDAHVHFRDPGHVEKEDFGTGSAGAAAGGVTTVIDMPNTAGAVYRAADLHAKRQIAESRSWVDFGLYGALDATNLDQARDLAQAGASAFKIFMYERPAPPPHGILDDHVLLAAFARAAEAGLPVCVHAENEDLVRHATEQERQTGRGDALAHLRARPAVAEVEAIQRAILLASEAGARLHICHVSSADGAAAIRAARACGASVTAEVTPQHLLLDSSLYSTLGAAMKMVPPIRDARDRLALWEALLDGSISMVATDHAPHTAAEKLRPDMLEAASGIPGVETSVPLMLTQVYDGRLTLEQYVRAASEWPARIFGLWPRKGAIRVGADADLTIVDVNRTQVVRGSALRSRARVTPFEGMTVRGVPVYTLVRGTIVMAHGELRGQPIGRMARPRPVLGGEE